MSQTGTEVTAVVESGNAVAEDAAHGPVKAAQRRAGLQPLETLVENVIPGESGVVLGTET